MSRSASLRLSSLAPSLPSPFSFVIYHWGDEYEISIIELLNIDGSSKSLTRSRQGRGSRPLCSPGSASPRLSHLEGSSRVGGSLYPTVIFQLLWNRLMSRHSLRRQLLSYITICRKKVPKLSNYALCRAAFIHCSRCVNYNESTGVWFDMIIEISNWVLVDLLCVRTDHQRNE